VKLARKRQQKETDHLQADLDRVERELNELEEENPLFIDEAWLAQRRMLEEHRDKLTIYLEELRNRDEA
jgi:hypothetical protein